MYRQAAPPRPELLPPQEPPPPRTRSRTRRLRTPLMTAEAIPIPRKRSGTAPLRRRRPCPGCCSLARRASQQTQGPSRWRQRSRAPKSSRRSIPWFVSIFSWFVVLLVLWCSSFRLLWAANKLEFFMHVSGNLDREVRETNATRNGKKSKTRTSHVTFRRERAIRTVPYFAYWTNEIIKPKCKKSNS